jgi:hypothetical protein
MSIPSVVASKTVRICTATCCASESWSSDCAPAVVVMPVTSLSRVVVVAAGAAFPAITATAWMLADEQMTWHAFVSFGA